MLQTSCRHFENADLRKRQIDFGRVLDCHTGCPWLISGDEGSILLGKTRQPPIASQLCIFHSVVISVQLYEACIIHLLTEDITKTKPR